jgi:acyl carrier protein
MNEDVRQFVTQALTEMNFEVEGVADDTPLGADGVDLESLSMAELLMQVEEEYGVKYSDEETPQLAEMTFGQFLADLRERMAPAGAGSPAE